MGYSTSFLFFERPPFLARVRVQVLVLGERVFCVC